MGEVPELAVTATVPSTLSVNPNGCGATSTELPKGVIKRPLGMTVFPFVASPVLKSLGDLSQKEFNTLMIQRKKLIPEWTKMILMIK